ncbi:MAG: sigma-70 family RNA polymerase sigma factor [Kofleriaceae bacterium]
MSALVTTDDELTALVRTYHARVVRYGRRACASPEDADDAIQEAFAKLAHRPDVVRHPGALSWLMTTIRRMCARMLPKRYAEMIDVADASAPSPAEALAQFELVRTMHDAIAALPVTSREILILRDLQGYSGEATCEALGIPLAAMKSRLHRARSELRRELVARGVIAA